MLSSRICADRHGFATVVGALLITLCLGASVPVHAADEPPAGAAGANPALSGVDWSMATEVVVELKDHSYEPDEIELKVGQPYKLVLQNVGRFAHDMVGGSLFEESVIALRMVNSQAGRVLANSVNSVYVRVKNEIELWFVPLKVGEFTFYCSIGGHREDGMEGLVRIVP